MQNILFSISDLKKILQNVIREISQMKINIDVTQEILIKKYAFFTCKKEKNIMLYLNIINSFQNPGINNLLFIILLSFIESASKYIYTQFKTSQKILILT